jgi:hypothetical protein
MKEYIIAFIVALIATAWVLDTKSPPGELRVGVSGVGEATKRKTVREIDATYGDFFIVDKAKLRTFETTISNDNDESGLHANFPLPSSPAI